MDRSAVWNLLNAECAPHILGDSIIESSEDLPSLMDVQWCALYPMAVYILRQLADLDRWRTTELQKPNAASMVGWKSVVDDYWTARADLLARFRTFLSNWHLADLFGIHPMSRQDRKAALETHVDEKILGFHWFNSWDEVLNYTLRWSENPLVGSSRMRNHRLIAHCGVDLICSELLSNGFDHGRDPETKMIILAKICVEKSAALSLIEHEKREFLTPHELKAFKFSVEKKCPLLQIVIGDTGEGFDRNDQLRQIYKTAQPEQPVTTENLIQFATHGKVSTKSKIIRRSFWRHERNSQERILTPTTHGLAEVKHTISVNNGFWRIHSGTTAVDFDFLPDGAASCKITRSLKAIPGCLHYIVLPLISPELRHEVPRHRTNSVTAKVDLLDSTVYFDMAPNDWVEKFLDDVLKIADECEGVMLIKISAFARVDGINREYAILDLLDVLFKCRLKCPVFLCSSDMFTESVLRRHMRPASIADGGGHLDFWIIPILEADSHATSFTLRFLVGAESVIGIERELSEVLLGLLDDIRPVIFEQHGSGVSWNTIEQIGTQNPKLLRVQGAFDDVTIVPTVVLDPALFLSWLLGERAFAALSVALTRHQAILPYSHEKQFVRLGKEYHTYVHIGRLWADASSRDNIARWCHDVLTRIKSQISARSDGHAEQHLVVIAILHPAIELAHQLLEDLDFELVEIRRRSDLRWDHEPLLRVAGDRVAILTDVMDSGRTLNRLERTIEFLGAQPVGKLSLLRVKDVGGDPNHFSFSTCEHSEVNATAKTLAALPGKKKYLIDASSQFTVDIDLNNPSLADYSLSTEAQQLIESGAISFGHWEVGNQHDSFVVLLRTLDYGNSDILGDISAKWNAFSPSAEPDLIVFPADSTAIHLAPRYAAFMNGRLTRKGKRNFLERLVVASPAFHSFGDYELRLELSDIQIGIIRASKVHVLCIDDSRTSGKTRRKIVAAIERERSSGSVPANTLFYVVLDRSRVGDRAHEKWSAAYTSIGPMSVERNNCAFCAAHSRTEQAIRWSLGARPGIRSLLKTMRRKLDIWPIERPNPSLEIIPRGAAIELLRLESAELPRVSVTMLDTITKQKDIGG